MGFILTQKFFIDDKEHVLTITDISDSRITGFMLDGKRFIDAEIASDAISFFNKMAKHGVFDEPKSKDTLEANLDHVVDKVNDTSDRKPVVKDKTSEQRIYELGVQWEEVEDDIIIGGYHTLGLDGLYDSHLLPNRSKSAIANRVNRLIKKGRLKTKYRIKNKVDKNIVTVDSKVKNKKGKKRKKIHNTSWTADEDKLLMEYHKKFTVTEIYKKNLIPGRTKSAILNRINMLIHENKMVVKTKETTSNLNFNHKVLEIMRVAIYEECFYHLLFKLNDVGTFSSKDVYKVIQKWYNVVRNKNLDDVDVSTQNDYCHDYITYGVKHGFFEKTAYNTYRKIDKSSKGRKGRPVEWTFDMDSYIKKWYHKMDINEIAEQLGKTERAIRARAEKLGVATDSRGGDQSNAESIPAGIKCDECGSSDIARDGTRHNKNEVVQRYLCNKCGHRFTESDKSFQMKQQLKFETMQAGAVAVKKECVRFILDEFKGRMVFSDDELLSRICEWYKNNMDRDVSSKIKSTYLNEYKSYLFKQANLFKITYNTSTFQADEKQKINMLKRFVDFINKNNKNRIGAQITKYDLQKTFLEKDIKTIFSILIQQNNALQMGTGIRLLNALTV